MARTRHRKKLGQSLHYSEQERFKRAQSSPSTVVALQSELLSILGSYRMAPEPARGRTLDTPPQAARDFARTRTR